MGPNLTGWCSAVVRRDTDADGNMTPESSSDSTAVSGTAPTPTRTKGARTRASRERTFNKFAMRYLPPYFCGVFADWMLGPYVYEVYTHYGYTMSEIGTLYVVGFVSSLRCAKSHPWPSVAWPQPALAI